MLQRNMSKQSGTILVASLKPYAKHKISNKRSSGKTSACGVTSFLFYLLTSVQILNPALCAGYFSLKSSTPVLDLHF